MSEENAAVASLQRAASGNNKDMDAAESRIAFRSQFIKSWGKHSAFLAAAVISVAYQGFRYGIENNALQVPILQVSGNPSLFVGNPFVATLHDYFSGVWGILAAMHLRIDWAPVFLALQIVSRYLSIVAFYFLLPEKVSRVRNRVLGAILLGNAAALFGVSPIGRHTMLVEYFEHTGLANGVLLLACAAWIRERRGWAWGLLGVTFDMNAFVGAWGVAAFSLASFARFERKASVRKAVRGLADSWPFLVCAAPGIFWIVKTMARNASAHTPAFDYRAFLQWYIPVHFFIGSTTPDRATTFALMLIGGVLALATLYPAGVELGVLSGAFVGVFLAGTILPYVSSSPMLLNLHVLRVDGIVEFLAAVAIVAACLREGKQGASPGISLSARMAALGGLLIGSWPVTAVAVAVLYATNAEPANARRRVLCALLPIILAAGMMMFSRPVLALTSDRLVTNGVVLALAILASLSGEAPSGNFAALVAAVATIQFRLGALLCATLLPHLVQDSRARRVQLGGDLIAFLAVLAQIFRLAGSSLGTRANEALLVLGALALGAQIARAWWDGHGADAKKFGKVPVPTAALVAATMICGIPVLAVRHVAAGEFTVIRPRRDDPWRDVQEWAKQHTPPETVFLVPLRGPIGFEIFSERSAWVDVKRAAGVMWSPSYYWVWKTRYQEQSDATDARVLARASSVCYAVIMRDNPVRTLPGVKWPDSSLEVVYANARYEVLSLCDRTVR